ncbi:MAG: TasA family protein [Clostridia bacterium]
MKTRILMSVLAIGLSIALIGGATMAWFTSESEPLATAFTAGTVEIERDATWGGVIDGNWNPGDIDDLAAKFLYTGTKDAFVRVKVELGWYDEPGDAEPNSELGTDNVELNIDDDYWHYEDGYYYYKEKITENPKELLLFNQVTLSGPETGNKYQGKHLKIKVTAQAIQASNDAYLHDDSIESPWEFAPEE